MYLSRICLSPDALEDARFWRTLESPYRLHQAIWDLFADGPDRRRDFLYRLDREVKRTSVFALSDREPPNPRGDWRVETKEFRPVLRTGERLAFSLRANPVITRDGDRHDVVMEEKRRLRQAGTPKNLWPTGAQLAQSAGASWLASRAAKHGFAADPSEVLVEAYEVHTFEKPGGRSIRFATCDFRGFLTVSDPETLLSTLRQGIGPAKGFGCGLLLIRRL